MTEQVTVTTDGRDIDAVIESLREAGFTVGTVHREIGVVSGTVAAANRSALESLPGVTAVESERTTRIAPPDAEIQ